MFDVGTNCSLDNPIEVQNACIDSGDVPDIHLEALLNDPQTRRALKIVNNSDMTLHFVTNSAKVGEAYAGNIYLVLLNIKYT